MSCLVVDVRAIQHNLRLIRQLCEKAGAEFLFVFKEVGMRPELMNCLLTEGSVSRLGVNCFGRLPVLPPDVRAHQIYLVGDDRFPDIVHADVVYQTGIRSIRRLAEAAKVQGVCPEVMLVVEMGDGRDGIEPDMLLPVAHEVLCQPFLRLRGLATNFACVSTEPPTKEALERLVQYKYQLEKMLGQPVSELSVGGSDVLELAATEPLPKEITEIRCGTAVHLGIYPLSGKAVPGASQRAFSLQGQVLECSWKKGRRQAILDFGALHTSPDRLYPDIPGMTLLGVSSGYSLYDVTDCPESVEEGMFCTFGLHFASLARAVAAVAELPLELRYGEDA